MKKLSLIGSLLFSGIIAFAQNNGNTGGNGNSGNALIHWKLNGNQATNSHFFGTVNEADLIFKTNSVERLRIGKDGSILFPQFSYTETEEKMLTVDKEGKLKSLPFAIGVVSAVYAKDCVPKRAYDENGNPMGGDATYPTPTWANKTGINEYGVLYTGTSCPARVGINTANPVTTFQVEGSGYFTSFTGIGQAPTADQSLLVRASSRDGIKINLLSSTKSGLIIESSNENSKVLVLRKSETEDVFRVYGNGNVWATEVNIALKTDFPDYVFEKSYYLRSLSEVEKFINSYKHLPDVPSAEEVKETGINVGEMNTILLRKIEELTLYMIELKKENEEMQKKISELQIK